MEYLTVLSPLGELLSPCGKLQFSTGFPCYDLASCVFFSLEDLLGSFCRLPCEVFVNLSWWCWHCVWTSLPTLQLDFVIHENLLWRFVFFVLVLCLFTTFLGRLLYFFSDVTVGLLLYLILQWLVCQRYDRTSLLFILLEDPFDQSCSSTDLPAAATSPCVATVHFRAIATGLLSNNVGSMLLP